MKTRQKGKQAQAQKIKSVLRGRNTVEPRAIRKKEEMEELNDFQILKANQCFPVLGGKENNVKMG